MTTHPRLFPLAAVLGGLALLATAAPAHGQYFPPAAFHPITRGFQFQAVNQFMGNPYAQGRYQWQVFSRVSQSGVGFYGNAYLYQFMGYYRPGAVGYNAYEPTTSLSSGFGSNAKVMAEQRSAIAEAQRNATWDKGATQNAPDFDRWLKDAATRREGPTAPEKGAKELPIDPALVNPPDEAILSGEALNRLAARIRELEKLGRKATPGLLAPELTTKIVFAGGPSDAANLYRGTELKYPTTLLGVQFDPLRKELDKAFTPVAKDAHAGKKTNPADVDRLLKAITKASELTRQTVADAPFTEACDVCEFYTTLESATKVLKDDKAAGVAGKEWLVVGATVAEVVQHQSKYGLRFGPAKSGEEAAYFSLHRGLLAYCVGLAQAK